MKLSEQFETATERIKRSCTMMASQIRCPHHFKDAKVEIEIGRLDFLYIEIFACCGEFENRVCEALRDNLDAVGDDFLYEMEGFGKIRLTKGLLDSPLQSRGSCAEHNWRRDTGGVVAAGSNGGGKRAAGAEEIVVA
jgi:hypothetical protein